MDYVFVALFGTTPVAAAHTKEDIEDLLKEYTQGEMVEYKPYDSKYPSINELEGYYIFKDPHDNSLLEFKVYSTEYRREK